MSSQTTSHTKEGLAFICRSLKGSQVEILHRGKQAAVLRRCAAQVHGRCRPRERCCDAAVDGATEGELQTRQRARIPSSGRLLFYAEALLFRAGDRQAALEALTDLESILADPRNAAAAADMPGTFYEDAIAALRAEACSDGDPDPMALGKVLLALPRPDDR